MNIEQARELLEMLEKQYKGILTYTIDEGENIICSDIYINKDDICRTTKLLIIKNAEKISLGKITKMCKKILKNNNLRKRLFTIVEGKIEKII